MTQFTHRRRSTRVTVRKRVFCDSVHCDIYGSVWQAKNKSWLYILQVWLESTNAVFMAKEVNFTFDLNEFRCYNEEQLSH